MTFKTVNEIILFSRNTNSNIQTTFLLHKVFFLLHFCLDISALSKNGWDKKKDYATLWGSLLLKTFLSLLTSIFLMHLSTMMMISSQRSGRIYLVENSPGITKMGKSIWYLSWEDGGAKFHLVLNFLVCSAQDFPFGRCLCSSLVYL